MSELPNTGIPVATDPATGTPAPAPDSTQTVPVTDQGTPLDATPAMIEESRYKNLQAHDTQTSQENAYLKRRLEELEARPAETLATPAIQTPDIFQMLEQEIDEQGLGDYDVIKKILHVVKAQGEKIEHATAIVAGSIAEEFNQFTKSVEVSEPRLATAGKFFDDFKADVVSIPGVAEMIFRVQTGQSTKEELAQVKAMMQRSLDYMKLKHGAASPAPRAATPTASAAAASATRAAAPPGVGGAGSSGLTPAPELDLSKGVLQSEVERIADEQMRAEFGNKYVLT